MGDGAAPRPLDGICVLVVDDDQDTLDILTAMLTYYGALPITAESGKAALERLAEVRVDVIVSDLSMPGFSGIELIRRVRGLPRQASRPTPAIALTAFAQPEHRQAALDSGFDIFHPKPFDPVLLVAQIAQLGRERDVRRRG
jgi:CheY-like chemotaxis protein